MAEAASTLTHGEEPAPAPLRRLERYMHTTAGTRVNTVVWLPPEGAPPCRGAVLFCHGYSHYCAVLYDWLAARLILHGIRCFGIEHVGHGKSEGLPGYVPSFDAIVDDALDWAALIRERELPAGTPLFIYGESLGGGIAIHAALREPTAFDGLLLFAPMVGLSDGLQPPWLLQQIGRAAACLLPWAPLAPVQDIQPLCFKNPVILPISAADPYRYKGGFRLRTAFELKEAMEVLSERAATLSTPFLLLHGTGDLITSPAASQRLFEACPSRDKTLLLYETAYHVMWFEPRVRELQSSIVAACKPPATSLQDTRRRLMADLVAWLSERCPAGAATRSLAGAALPAAVVRLERRPAGTEPFEGDDPGHASTPFMLSTHARLYEGSHPRDSAEVLQPLPRARRDAVLRRAEAVAAAAAPAV